MRSLVVLSALLGAVAASAQDARVDFLRKQLQTASDPRLRVQSAISLGALGVPSAIDPLCVALKDPESVVRQAAAKALGDMANQNAVPCLKARRSDPSSDVKLAVARALELLEKPKQLYVFLELVQDDGGTSADDRTMAESLIRAELAKIGATFAPSGESASAAASVLRSKKMKGYLLKPKLRTSDAGIELKLLVLTYPEKELKGANNAKGKGPKAALLKALVQRVVGEAASDNEWAQ